MFSVSASYLVSRRLRNANALGPLGWTIQSIGNGQRSSSATSYLKPAQSRPNLEIIIHAQVTKLLQTGTTRGHPAFRCVQFVQHEGGESFYLVIDNNILTIFCSTGQESLC